MKKDSQDRESEELQGVKGGKKEFIKLLLGKGTIGRIRKF